MPKKILYAANFFATDTSGNSYVKYAAGTYHDRNDDTDRHIAMGIAEEVNLTAKQLAALTDQASLIPESAAAPVEVTTINDVDPVVAEVPVAAKAATDPAP